MAGMVTGDELQRRQPSHVGYICFGTVAEVLDVAGMSDGILIGRGREREREDLEEPQLENRDEEYELEREGNIVRKGRELAVEGCGMSVRREMTIGGIMGGVRTVPAAPEAPTLVSASATSMAVEWQEPNNSDSPVTDYTLEHDDGETGPFTRVYTGEKRHYTIEGLKSGHVYRVRVMAHNQKGKGPFSTPAELLTGFAAPSPPPTPTITEHSTTCIVIAWGTPEHENGSPVTAFEVEMKQSAALGWTLIYYGIANTYTVTGLSPGIHIGVRVRAVNLMGNSGWSGEAQFSTLPGPPEPSSAPGTQQRSRAVRAAGKAKNAAGSSGFSASSIITTSPASANPPSPPIVVATTTSSLTVRWEVPEQDNGSPVHIRYTLEMLKVEFNRENLLTKKGNFVGGKKHGKKKLGKQDATGHLTSTLVWDPVYDGQGLRYEVVGLSPGNEYSFRVKTHNTLGTSPPSLSLVARTLSTAPGAPQPPTFTRVAPTSVQIKWSSPACDNGMPVRSYKLLLDDGQGGRLRRIYEGAATSYKASKLVPASSYRVAVQAINALGASELSGVAVVELPVAPPTAEVELSSEETPAPTVVKAKQEVTDLMQCLQQKIRQIRQPWSQQTRRWTCVVGIFATVVAAKIIAVY